ncbi:MAG TPA: hypothetical protein VNA87_03420 [Actinomycetota bacterium]|nr:hypothetical protein [Actinomycetota bacterium]
MRKMRSVIFSRRALTTLLLSIVMAIPSLAMAQSRSETFSYGGTVIGQWGPLYGACPTRPCYTHRYILEGWETTLDLQINDRYLEEVGGYMFASDGIAYGRQRTEEIARSCTGNFKAVAIPTWANSILVSVGTPPPLIESLSPSLETIEKCPEWAFGWEGEVTAQFSD